MKKILPSEVTPEPIYISRRKFMIGISALAAVTLIDVACRNQVITPTPVAGFCDGATALAGTDELGAKLTPCTDDTN